MGRVELTGWASTQQIGTDGSVDSEQRVTLDRPVVECSDRGARELSFRYWAELQRSGRRWMSVREHAGGIDLRLLGFGPVLIALGPVETAYSPASATARHAIRGGLLVRRSGGSIAFEQLVGEQVELRSTIDGFNPRRGPFYAVVQRRFHLALSRRYFRRLIGGDPP
ncbi:MAG TPA: hypothetical protein VFT76_02900 [Actinomycetota bacterium]|nr:hypothetical protein [Actinomycetota bacterium]